MVLNDGVQLSVKNCYNNFVNSPSQKTIFIFCLIVIGLVSAIFASRKIGTPKEKQISFINNSNSFSIRENKDVKPDNIMSSLASVGIDTYDQEIIIMNKIDSPLVFEISDADKSPLYGAALPKVDQDSKKITMKVYLPENNREYFVYKLSESYLYSLVMASKVILNPRPTINIGELNQTVKVLMDQYEESGNYPVIVK